MPDQTSDQRLEFLRQTNAKLYHALECIDKDIERAARKYLHPVVERGYLKFYEFLELLVAEVTWKARKEAHVNSGNIRDLFTREIAERLEARIEALLPVIKGRLSDYVTFPVMVALRKEQKIGDRPYYAIVLRGTFKRGYGDTPESAYEDLRARFAVELFELGVKEFLVTKHLDAVDGSGLARWNRSDPLRDDEIEGFKIQVRLAAP